MVELINEEVNYEKLDQGGLRVRRNHCDMRLRLYFAVVYVTSRA